jgi:hypothetical protein
MKIMQSIQIDGYRGLWFDLKQRSTYGSKYSGGLGTYTAKHHPLAIYSEEAQKTFFVYGGTTKADQRHLLLMVSYYDHQTDLVPKPITVFDKEGVDDPHDNPSINIDENGYIWVFVSGRGNVRPGFKYKSLKPYEIDLFEKISEEEFTYCQPWWIKGSGFFHFFTKYQNGETRYQDDGKAIYTDQRELFWNTSSLDGRTWSKAQKLVGMGGHYQMSNHQKDHIITAFNWHPKSNVDARTNLYFLQTRDLGNTWQTADGTGITVPLGDPDSPALVRDYQNEGRLIYVKDIGFDLDGNPVLLYLTSANYEAGPEGNPRTWTIAHWKNNQWNFREITISSHNYDMGSLYIEPDGIWRLIAPTEIGPQEHGTGGEVALWISQNEGETWTKEKQVTRNSPMNHGYVRRPVKAHPDFYAFWADGNPDKMSKSHLYFTNKTGDRVWQLPYDMEDEFVAPALLDQPMV